MGKLNVGIVGHGWAAGAPIDAIQQTRRGRVTSIYSSRARQLDVDELSEKHGTQLQLNDDFDVMLAEVGLDVVDIATFPNQHSEYAIRAAAARKHLIIEKPLALSWRDCQAIRQAANAAGMSTCVCFECRYSQQFITAKRLIDNDVLGRLHYGEVDYYHGIGPWYEQYR
jgi:predicted dehydrogenase